MTQTWGPFSINTRSAAYKPGDRFQSIRALKVRVTQSQETFSINASAQETFSINMRTGSEFGTVGAL